ncbi:NAD(P)-binding protein [Polyplosphaeria fusca]|uniref:NAD(P)-binding protein n=1 Tax=Polyplosphaeria fusca TaxID=682080 RepID=A0A9P4R074_9PLEO|nr:NAD(P)-binding protein [Polyplosphaeria fusca]
MSPSTETLLLTGATGNLGAATLDQLLSTTSHNINAIIRNPSTAIPHFQSKYPSAISSGRLTFTTIPDMTLSGSFDAAASTATLIMHLATPLAYTDFLSTMITPTWSIDHNILTAAQKSGTVKRVVICGTAAQTLRMDRDIANAELVIDESRFNDVTLEEAEKSWPDAYSFAKTQAEIKTWAWMEERKGRVGFDVVMLLPPAIIGRSLQIGDVDDVALTHIRSLSPSIIPGNQRYLVAAPSMLDLRGVARELRATDAGLAARIPDVEPRASAEWKTCKLDTSKADKVFGREWKGQVESVRAVVRDVVEWEKENGRVI